MAESNLTSGLTGLFPTGREGHFRASNRKDPAVRNGNPVRIAPQIFDGIAEAVEGLFNVGAPVFAVKGILKVLPTRRGPQGAA